jgi:dipeptidyl-peptidase-4
VFPYVDGLQGDLFIYHGMADDNVLFTNSTRVYRALQERMIPFWSMDYPGEKHGMRDYRTRIHQHRMLERFFDQSLKVAN